MIDPKLYNQPAAFRGEVERLTHIAPQYILAGSKQWPIGRRKTVLEWLLAAANVASFPSEDEITASLQLATITGILRTYADNKAPVIVKLLGEVEEATGIALSSVQDG